MPQLLQKPEMGGGMKEKNKYERRLWVCLESMNYNSMQDLKEWDGLANRKSVKKHKKTSKGNEELIEES